MAGDLIAPETARGLVIEHVRPLDRSERIAIGAAQGRTLAGDLVSGFAVPPFDNSAMDGFAVRSEDVSQASATTPALLEIVDESRAGNPARRELQRGQAIRISTGAMLPIGCDAVVRIEDCEQRAEQVAIMTAVRPGKEIRRAGEDIASGERVLERGTTLGPAELGVAAEIGAATLECAARPLLACLATGDELVEPGKPLDPGQIHDSNAFSIPAQAADAGAEPLAAKVVRDDYTATVDALRAALEQADLVVATGGVSVGPHDHVKPALAELAVEQVFWRVALRPGKPTWFGVAGDGTPVFGLPGNPVSAMVTFHLFVRPAIARLTGADCQPRLLEAVFDADYPKKPGRAHVLRCKVSSGDGRLRVTPTKAQGSHVLTSMLGADALTYLEVDRGDVSAGERVQVELL